MPGLMMHLLSCTWSYLHCTRTPGSSISEVCDDGNGHADPHDNSHAGRHDNGHTGSHDNDHVGPAESHDNDHAGPAEPHDNDHAGP